MKYKIGQYVKVKIHSECQDKYLGFVTEMYKYSNNIYKINHFTNIGDEIYYSLEGCEDIEDRWWSFHEDWLIPVRKEKLKRILKYD